MSAALAAAHSGAKVLLIESGERLGGQYWRHLPENGPKAWTGQESLAGDFARGALLRAKVMQNPHIEVLFNTHIWQAGFMEGQSILQLLQGYTRWEIKSETVIIATGAYDRALPFPGWDIPGVMTPGGAQALLKGSAVKVGKRVVVAGTGPFLLPVATGLLEAGVEVVGFFEANRTLGWIKYFRVGMSNISKLKQARNFFNIFRAHNVKLQRGFAVMQAHAGEDGQLNSVTVARIDSKFRRKRSDAFNIPCDALAIGWGFTPELSVANSLGLRQIVSSEDESVVVEVDDTQGTSREGIYAAGEVTGIGGSELSLIEGEIAGLAASVREGTLSTSAFNQMLLSLARKRRREQKFASALLRMHPVGSGWIEWVSDKTVICRCEEVTQAEIKAAVHELGATDSRTVKLFTRCGMGMCQGRVCARSVIDIVASESKVDPSLKDRISAGSRPIINPLALGVLASGALADCGDVEPKENSH